MRERPQSQRQVERVRQMRVQLEVQYLVLVARDGGLERARATRGGDLGDDRSQIAVRQLLAVRVRHERVVALVHAQHGFVESLTAPEEDAVLVASLDLLDFRRRRGPHEVVHATHHVHVRATLLSRRLPKSSLEVLHARIVLVQAEHELPARERICLVHELELERLALAAEV